jgi:hypothetical protein
MYKLCQEVMWLDAVGRASTYCMREVGHKGKHNPLGNFEPEDPAIKKNETPTAGK